MFKKRAEMGISTMIILIAGILIVSLICGLYLYTTHKFESESYKTTDKTSKYVSTKVTLSDIQSTYYNTSYIKNITGIINIETSEPVKLGDLSIHIKTSYSSSTIEYGNGSLTHNADGFYTRFIETYTVPSTLLDDWDDDRQADVIYAQGSTVRLNLSSGPRLTLGQCSTPTTFISTISTNEYVNEVSAICIGSIVSQVTLTPTYTGKGFYSIEYLKQSNHFLDGMLNSGDMVKIYFELAEPLGTEELVTITLIPKVGTATEIMFITPDTPSIGTAYLGHY